MTYSKKGKPQWWTHPIEKDQLIFVRAPLFLFLRLLTRTRAELPPLPSLARPLRPLD